MGLLTLHAQSHPLGQMYSVLYAKTSTLCSLKNGMGNTFFPKCICLIAAVSFNLLWKIVIETVFRIRAIILTNADLLWNRLLGIHLICEIGIMLQRCPDSKVYVVKMGPTWILLAPSGPHVGPMCLSIRVFIHQKSCLKNVDHFVHCQMCQDEATWFSKTVIDIWTHGTKQKGKRKKTPSTLNGQQFSEETQTCIYILCILQHWNDTSTWTPSSCKTRTYLFYIFNIMGADVLAV